MHCFVKFRNESGRSLVEMLGVLAVMGIIALTGIKIFHSSMVKHQANELIYEAQKRATSVAAQIMAGGDNLSVAEFKNPTGYAFGVNKENDRQFNITITGVSEEICYEMKNLVGDETVVRKISNECDKLTYNNDLSTTFYVNDYPTPEACIGAGNSWCGGLGECRAHDCCAGLSYDTQCQVCNQGAIISSPQEGKTCTYRDGETQKTGICHLGACEPAATGMTCNPNQFDCTCTVMENGNPVMVDGQPLQGHICSMDRTTNTVKLCCRMEELCTAAGEVGVTSTPNQAECLTLTGANTECNTNADCKDPAKPWCKISRPSNDVTQNCRNLSAYKGTCTALGSSITTMVTGLGEVLVGPEETWFSAKNWCEAHGKKLINIEAFQVYYATGTHAGELVATASASGTVPACRQGKVCERWDNTDAQAMWAGTTEPARRTLTGAQDANGELYSNLYSPVVLDLAQKFKGAKKQFWTASDTDFTSSCYGFIVNVNKGTVEHGFRVYGSYILCE